MPYSLHGSILVWGQHETPTVKQLAACIAAGGAPLAALMADGHPGCSQPIGGVVAYEDLLSPSGVGTDIACGNKAVRTRLRWRDIRRDIAGVMSDLYATVSFGQTRRLRREAGHPVLEEPLWRDLPFLAPLQAMAREQLGTVGGGNHYIDLLVETPADGERSLRMANARRLSDLDGDAPVWVAVHFGSRGPGYRIANGFMNLAENRPFEAPRADQHTPILIPADSDLGQAYLTGLELAGRYAYAGRDLVVEQVLSLLGTQADFTVHNHHNFTWRETHGGRPLWVVRKGATPLWPGQYGFIGGSMGDLSVVVRGVESEESAMALYSTVHGAGRVMSRTQAAGKWGVRRGRRVRTGGAVDFPHVQKVLRSQGIELRGGEADEAPQVYRKLADVLPHHAPTFELLHLLRPVGVAMAGPEEQDPYKD